MSRDGPAIMCHFRLTRISLKNLQAHARSAPLWSIRQMWIVDIIGAESYSIINFTTNPCKEGYSKILFLQNYDFPLRNNPTYIVDYFGHKNLVFFKIRQIDKC